VRSHASFNAYGRNYAAGSCRYRSAHVGEELRIAPMLGRGTTGLVPGDVIETYDDLRALSVGLRELRKRVGERRLVGTDRGPGLGQGPRWPGAKP
jgi:hypothetical protein